MISRFAPKQDLIVLSLIRLPLGPVRAQLARDLVELHAPRWSRKRGKFSLRHCFTGQPPPGSAHKHRVLVFSPRPKAFTVITANLQDGWSSLSWRISTKSKVDTLILGFSSDAVSYPRRSFDWLQRGKEKRHVSVSLDGKWRFYQEGKPLLQEDVSPYKKRVIKERLTNEGLMSLAQALDYDLDPRSELSGQGQLFTQIGPVWKG